MITAEDVRRIIVEHDANRPRSRQTSIGPSDLSAECDRRLVYHLLDVPRDVPKEVSMQAWVGTAMHASMEAALAAHPDWKTELPVSIPITDTVTLTGSLDAYHEPSTCIVDWKSAGPSVLAKYRHGNPANYDTQVDLYGLGATLAGLTVTHVAIAYLPRNGSLKDIHVNARPWDQERAEAAIRRYENLLGAAAGGPAVLPHVPIADSCRYCPWWLPGSDRLDVGCPGVTPTDSTVAIPPPWEPKVKETAS